MEKRHRLEVKQFEREMSQRLKKCKGGKLESDKLREELQQQQLQMQERHKTELNQLISSSDDATGVEQLDDAMAHKMHLYEMEQKHRKARTEKKKREEERRRRKREKLEQEVREELAAQGGSARDRELLALSEVLAAENLAMHVIDSDGHCLYRAFAHQLKLAEPQLFASVDYSTVRKRIAEHMRSQMDHYIHFIETPTGEPLTTEQYMEYCDQVEKSAEWGGHVEIQAFVDCYEKCVRIYQANTSTITMGEEFKDRGPTIRVSYHRHYYALGEHYNSIVPPKKTNGETGGQQVEVGDE